MAVMKITVFWDLTWCSLYFIYFILFHFRFSPYFLYILPFTFPPIYKSGHRCLPPIHTLPLNVFERLRAFSKSFGWSSVRDTWYLCWHILCMFRTHAKSTSQLPIHITVSPQYHYSKYLRSYHRMILSVMRLSTTIPRILLLYLTFHQLCYSCMKMAVWELHIKMSVLVWYPCETQQKYSGINFRVLQFKKELFIQQQVNVDIQHC
jgi:hypothetical protein